MAGLTDYAENKLLDHVLGTTSYTHPSQAYLALFTAAPSDAGGGTEVSGSGYSRIAVNFSAASAGATSNSDAPHFVASGGNWGTITHAACFDASTSGNMLVWGALTVSRVINDGDALDFAIGDLDVTMD